MGKKQYIQCNGFSGDQIPQLTHETLWTEIVIFFNNFFKKRKIYGASPSLMFTYFPVKWCLIVLFFFKNTVNIFLLKQLVLYQYKCVNICSQPKQRWHAINKPHSFRHHHGTLGHNNEPLAYKPLRAVNYNWLVALTLVNVTCMKVM